jgi:GNAT superfamily N-acetyltransferase
MRKAMTSSAFADPPIELLPARLSEIVPSSCDGLAAKIAAIAPWSVMDYPADALARFLRASDYGASRYLIEVDGVEAGAMAVRYPWLKGPYLELLAILPPFQGNGLGAKIMAWFEGRASQLGARNLWVCASAFNDRALRFYARHGFAPAATVPGLVADGYDEILLRKFPLGPDSLQPLTKKTRAS